MKTITAFAAAAALAVGMTAATVPADAHHSAAMFDDTVELVLEGVVTRFDYLNPHSWLYMEVTNEDGTTTEWGFELDAPPRLRRVGIGPHNWEPGEAITVVTNPLRDGRSAGHLHGALKDDGTVFGNVEAIEAKVAE